MYQFTLNTGELVTVDECDKDFVQTRHWVRVKTRHGKMYVRTVSSPSQGNRVSVLLHRAITQAPFGLQVDHRNGDTLDNRRKNLRVVTAMVNQQGFRTKQPNTRSRYRGVSWLPHNKKWQAKITLEKKQIYLGIFRSEQEAAECYDTAARDAGFPNESTNAWMEKSCLLPHKNPMACSNS